MIVIIILIISLFLFFYDTIRLNFTQFIIVQRGLIAQNCLWWSISDLFNVGSGIQLYQHFKNSTDAKVIPKYMLGDKINIITDICFIKQILKQSPFPFGVGKHKYAFFQTFMELNVGVSEGCPWKRRRVMNEQVLETDVLENVFQQYIWSTFDNETPTDFKSFSTCAKQISMKIVFGDDSASSKIFDMFKKSNSILGIVVGTIDIPIETRSEYEQYIIKNIQNPLPNSLVSLIPKDTPLTLKEVLHQVPHWIFPINGIISVHLPRLLTVLSNAPHIVDNIIHSNYNKEYIRKCILEFFRLYNAVFSTFRTLLTDYSFDNSGRYDYKKGDQFFISNTGVLREPKIFENPNAFIPERWNPELEQSCYALMFNQGPQKCPGKELAIFIMMVGVDYFLRRYNGNITSNTVLDISKMSETINPCSLNLFG